MLNKNIVHLIDDISGIWDSKRRPRPTANYINYTYFINYVHYTNYIAYTHYCRFVRILELRTTCGRRRERNDLRRARAARAAERREWAVC